MRVLILSLLALVSFSKTDFVNENLRLRKTNTALLNALRSLSQEQAQTRKERQVGSLPEDCWYYDGYEEDCPEGCVWTHFSRGTGMCNAPGVAATRTLSEEKAVGADTETEKAVGAAVKEKAVGERTVGNSQCDHINEDNKSSKCNVYYRKIAKCDICQDDNAGAVDNSAINDAIRKRAQTREERKVGALPEDCWYYDGYEEDCPEGCVWTHFSRGDGMCNAPGVAATSSLSEEKAVGADYSVYAQKTWCRDWDSMSYDSLRTTPTVTYEQCKQKCESIATCNYFLHGERVMDSKMNRCVTWDRCDMRGGYNDGSPTVYERAEWRSPFAGMDEDTVFFG